MVEYEPIEPVFDPEKAMESGAPLIHPDLHKYTVAPIFQAKPQTNICSFVNIEKGNIQKGFEFPAEGIGKISIKKEQNSLFVEIDPSKTKCSDLSISKNGILIIIY